MGLVPHNMLDICGISSLLIRKQEEYRLLTVKYHLFQTYTVGFCEKR